MLYQPCAAKTYTSSKVMDHLSVLDSYAGTLSDVPTTRKKKRSRQGMRITQKTRPVNCSRPSQHN